MSKILQFDKYYALKYTKYYLNSCGVAVESQTDTSLFALYKYYLLVSFAVLTYGQCMHYENVKDIPNFAKTTVFVSSGIYLNFCTLYVHFRKKEFLEMMRLKNNNFHRYPNDKYNTYGGNVDEDFYKIVKKYGTIWSVSYALVGIIPAIMTPFSEYELGSPETMMMPCKYPWKMDTLSSYILTYLLQICCITPISVPVVGMVFFMVYFMMEVRFQTKKLCFIVNDIERSSHAEAEMEGKVDEYVVKKKYNVFSLEKLDHCLKHHQNIFRFINNFILCMEAMFIVNLIYSIVTISLAGYTVIGRMVRFSWYMQYMSLLCSLFTYILLYCHLGEIISECNGQIRETLYNTDWYNLETKFRKKLIIFMCITQNHRNLRASASYIASYQLFTGIIKGSYTYMNLLLQSYSRQ